MHDFETFRRRTTQEFMYSDMGDSRLSAINGLIWSARNYAKTRELEEGEPEIVTPITDEEARYYAQAKSYDIPRVGVEAYVRDVLYEVIFKTPR